MEKVTQKVNSRQFYEEWSGHQINHLSSVVEGLKAQEKKHLVYLAGDSTLDNKAWFNDEINALNGYENILSSKRAKPDVSYWINNSFVERNLGDWACVNTSVEATSVIKSWQVRKGRCFDYDE